jgi:hypothetical protein
MFKHFSEIIGKFSSTQRIFALLILCCSGVFLYIGPTVIRDIKCSDCERESREQNEQIRSLYKTLGDQQSECTDLIFEREMVFRRRLDTLQIMLMEIKNTRSHIITQKVEQDPHTINDTVMMNPAPTREIRVIKREPVKVDRILEKIECYQRDTLNHKR